MGVRPTVPSHRIEIAHHHRERLLLPVVPSPQPRQRRERTTYVHAPPALGDADDPSVQLLREIRHRIVAGDALPPPVQNVVFRPAPGAADRLVVEPPGGRVVVLVAAVGAHREVVHGRLGAVVWQVIDDGEPGPAVGAVGERIEVAPSAWREHLSLAVVAHRRVVRDADPPLPGRAGNDAESNTCLLVAFQDLDGIEAGEGRQFVAKPLDERIGIAIDDDDHVGAVVLDPPVEVHGGRDAVHRRPEAHSLHYAAHDDPHRPFQRQMVIIPFPV